MPGLLRGVARTAVVAGTASAVSGRVQRRQAEKYAGRDAQIAADRSQAYEQDMAEQAPPPQYAQAPPPPPAPARTAGRRRRPAARARPAARRRHPHRGGVRGPEGQGPRLSTTRARQGPARHDGVPGSVRGGADGRLAGPWLQGGGAGSEATRSDARRGSAPEGMEVARGGVEPPTFRFSVGRSYQLSYLAGNPARRTGRRPGSPWRSDPDGTRTRDLRRDRAAR